MRYIMNGPLRKKIHNKKIIHVYCCHTDKNVRLSGNKHIQDTQLSYQYQHNTKVNQTIVYARPSVVYIMHGIGDMTHFFYHGYQYANQMKLTNLPSFYISNKLQLLKIR